MNQSREIDIPDYRKLISLDELGNYARLWQSSATMAQRLMDTGVVQDLRHGDKRYCSLSDLDMFYEMMLTPPAVTRRRFPGVTSVFTELDLRNLPRSNGDFSVREMDLEMCRHWDSINEVIQLLHTPFSQSNLRALIITPPGLLAEHLYSMIRSIGWRSELTWRTDPSAERLARELNASSNERCILIMADEHPPKSISELSYDVIILLRPTLSRRYLLNTIKPFLQARPSSDWPTSIIELVGIGRQIRFEQIGDELRMGDR